MSVGVLVLRRSRVRSGLAVLRGGVVWFKADAVMHPLADAQDDASSMVELGVLHDRARGALAFAAAGGMSG